MKTAFLGVAAALSLLGASSNATAITIGTSDSGNCSLGGCLSGSFEYEQIYSASAFGQPITFNQITFFDLPSSAPNPDAQQPTPNAVFGQGDYTITLATTTAPLGSAFPVGPLTNLSTFYVGMLGGAFDTTGAFDITGSPYSYDPANGNLVLILTTTDGTGPCCSYLDNDLSGLFISRAYYQSFEGTNSDLTGLVTEFNSVPAPIVGAGLPGMLSVLMCGGFLAWRHRKRKPQLAGS
jgi:hypothetical protein